MTSMLCATLHLTHTYDRMYENLPAKNTFAVTPIDYCTKSISPPPNYCFLVGAVKGRWFNIYLFLKGVNGGR